MTWDELDLCLDNAMKIGRQKTWLPRSSTSKANASLVVTKVGRSQLRLL